MYTFSLSRQSCREVRKCDRSATDGLIPHYNASRAVSYCERRVKVYSVLHSAVLTKKINKYLTIYVLRILFYYNMFYSLI